MLEITGSTALITGGAKRIGRAVALALAREGCNVLIHFNASRDGAAEVVRLARGEGVQAWAVQADLSAPESAEGLFETCLRHHAPIDILINSASIFPGSTIGSATLDDFRLNLDVNAMSPFLLCRKFAAQQVAGSIVNLLDTRIVGTDDKHVAYHVSKRVLYTLSRLLSRELAPSIRVNAVAPGLILPPAGEDDSYLSRMAHTNLLNAHGGLDDIEQAVLFLLKSNFITGQVIFVDGGRHMKGSFYGT